MKKNKLITTAALTATMLLATMQPSLAAIEIDEEDFGPSYNSMVVDTVVGKPVQFANAVGGTVAYVVSLPLSVIGGNESQARRELVVKPWQAMRRCLGCTVAYDNYHKAAAENQNMVRIVVDQPSEIFINTDDNVVVVSE